jgi:hypothetical protein
MSSLIIWLIFLLFSNQMFAMFRKAMSTASIKNTAQENVLLFGKNNEDNIMQNHVSFNKRLSCVVLGQCKNLVCVT